MIKIGKNILRTLVALMMITIVLDSCKDDETPSAKNPDTAPDASIDRFSDAAGTLMKRSAVPALPAANAAINFDSGEPFITKGLGPGGELVEYYNFDVQNLDPAPIYAFFKPGQESPTGLNVVGVIPGDELYNDFWRIYKVNVPANYVANSLTSKEDIVKAGYTMEATDIIVNCPVVPKGSVASKRIGNGSAELSRGWYNDQIVYYFNFTEKELMVNDDDQVPTSPIYVTFNLNPEEENPATGPASGFKSETGGQTHNVVETLPEDTDYSPLWSVNPYDNDDFDSVKDLVTALESNVLAEGVATVNCPIVSIQQ